LEGGTRLLLVSGFTFTAGQRGGEVYTVSLTYDEALRLRDALLAAYPVVPAEDPPPLSDVAMAALACERAYRGG
jgi:hypothetical protein